MDFPKLINRYALALCCVIAPLLLGYWAPNFAASYVFPKLTGAPFDYVFVEALQPSAPTPAASNVTDDQKKAFAEQQENFRKQQEQIQNAGRFADTYSGRYAYVAASGFLYLVSFAALLVAGAVIYRSGRFWLLGVCAIVFVVLAYGVARVDTAYEAGATTILKNLLNATDTDKAFGALTTARKQELKDFATGTAAENLIFANTLIALIPVGFLLAAFAVVAVRDDRSLETPPAELAAATPEEKAAILEEQAAMAATLEDMQASLVYRKTAITALLALSSMILFVAVVASKLLIDWPLKLVFLKQREVLKPIADALTTHLGATGSIGLLAAATPAVAAWMLDGDRHREAAIKLAKVKKEPPPPPPSELEFKAIPVITNVLIVVAPLLAGPIAELVKTLAGLVK